MGSGKAAGKVTRRSVTGLAEDKVRGRPVARSKAGLWQGQWKTRSGEILWLGQKKACSKVSGRQGQGKPVARSVEYKVREGLWQGQ